MSAQTAEIPNLRRVRAGVLFKAVDAQISFTVDGKGNVTGLTLHQGGQDVPGMKIK